MVKLERAFEGRLVVVHAAPRRVASMAALAAPPARNLLDGSKEPTAARPEALVVSADFVTCTQ